MRNTLAELDCKGVDETDSGIVALEKLRDSVFDLVITDWNIPTKTGLNLAKAVRADVELASTAILLITAEPKREEIIEAVRAGIKHYVIKPFENKALKSKLISMFP